MWFKIFFENDRCNKKARRGFLYSVMPNVLYLKPVFYHATILTTALSGLTPAVFTT